ncbi:hypothetical protein N7G274_008435 [Stereocaulon virgatum]|uniref:Uncharacterized protein n=1 Tax=Stereocaulon virgatum TaxID=373712 RepID=A0ABR3ZYA8_9LECA
MFQLSIASIITSSGPTKSSMDMHPSLQQNLLYLLIVSANAITAFPRDNVLSSKKSSNKRSTLPIKHDTPAFCTSSVAWSGAAGIDSNLIQDCTAAASTFWSVEVMRHGGSEFEFVNKDTAPAYHNSKQRTPRRYTHGTCTVSVINKPDVPTPYWPGVPLSPSPATDTASYNDIYFSILTVIAECLHDHTHLGWALAGQHGGLVILIFRSHSPVDLAIPPNPGRNNLINMTAKSVQSLATKHRIGTLS